MYYLERNTNHVAMPRACVFPIACQPACHTVHVRTFSLQFFSVIVDACKPTSQLVSRASRIFCALRYRKKWRRNISPPFFSISLRAREIYGWPARLYRSLTIILLWYNRAKAYDCAIESEAVAHASCIEVTSFIRRYHAYQDVWQPCVEIFVCPLCSNLSNLSSAYLCPSVIRELICIAHYTTPYL